MTETDEDARAKLTELIKSAKICMLTTMTADGRHVSRPMGLQEVEFDGDLWFFADQGSAKVAEISTHPQVNVAISDLRHHSWVSLTGSAEVVHDRDKAEELWNPFLKAWFPQGLEAPGLTLIKVHAESAEYWDAPNGAVITLIGLVTSAFTGKRPTDMAEHGTVALS